MEANSTLSEPSSRPDPLLVLPVLLSVAWAIYELFYAPRVLAFLITKLANLFLTDSGIYIRSVRVHVLTGRLIFKDLHYYTRDYSLRVFDGYLSLRWWWKTGNNVCKSCDRVQRTAPFLQLTLNGLEWHWYNRSEVYDNWGVVNEETNAEELTEQEESGFGRWWNSLHPSVHISIRKGRILLGNHLVERTLVVYFASAESHYTITEASNQFDERMHVVNFDTRLVKVVLEPSVGYKGPVSEERPPVLCEGMEDAYLFLKTDNALITYLLDSPGITPLGDNPSPKYAFDVKLGSNTVVNYSCYGNRQRNQMQKIFFPNDHTEKPYTQLPEPGQRRIYTMFDIFIETTSPLTAYHLFSDRHGHTAHLAVAIGTGSRISLHQPWVYARDGQLSVVKGSLRNVQITSSLDYQVLGSADSLDFQTDLQFPRLWNATQTWNMRFTGDTVQANVLFAYIDFINDLLDDWLGHEPNDLLTFVPLNWNISIDLTRYEIFLFTNRYNWIDVAMDAAENTRLAFCGTSGQITLEFPFTRFNPPEQEVHFKVVGENIVVRRYVSPSSATKQSVLSLSSLNKHRWRSMSVPGGEQPTVTETTQPPSNPLPITVEVTTPGAHVISAPIIGDLPSPTKSFRPPSSLGHTSPIKTHHTSLDYLNEPDADELPDNESIPMGYRGVTQYKDGWVDLASGPTITIAIDYTSHAHDTTPGQYTRLHPNVMRVDIEAPTVLLRVFGFLGRDLLALNENYTGEFMNFKTFNSNIPTPQSVPERPPPPNLGSAPPPAPPPDGSHEPSERTLWMYVNFRLRNVTAEFPTHLPEGWPRDFPLPSVVTEQVGVRVEYTNRETMVWLEVEPVSVHLPTKVPEPLSQSTDFSSVNELGHMIVSGVSLRCHGFTELLCEERVEYAWLINLTIKRIAGTVSTLQLATALDWFATVFAHTASFGDGCQVAPDGDRIEPKIEPISEEIKYKLFHFMIEEGDLAVADGDALTRIQTPGFDLGFCTLHSEMETLGLSFQLHGVTVTTFAPLDDSCLVESGLVDLGPISGDLSLREPLDCVPQRQMDFLKLADKNTKRLWFLWDTSDNCGCWGACMFQDGSVQRPLTRGKKDCTVYNAKMTTRGLESLENGLLGHTIRDIDCLQTIHKSLLEHYQHRYTTPTAQSLTPSRPYSYMSDDDSFVSARSSLTSLLLEERSEFVSFENLDSVSSKLNKLKSKPPPLILSDSIDSGDSSLETYKDVSHTHKLDDVRLRVRMDTQVNEDKAKPLHFPVKRSCSDGAALHPKNTLKRTANQEYLLLRVPQLSPCNEGQIPLITPRGTGIRTKERPRRRARPQRKNENSMATFSLSVSVEGAVRAVLTPMASNTLQRLLESVHYWYNTRSHLAIVDSLSHSCLATLRDHFTQLHNSDTPELPRPLLHLSVTMETQSSLAIQLFQVPKKKNQIPTGMTLKEITRHMTLINVFISGLRCHTLFQTSKEVGGASKRILSSVDILGRVNLQTLQTSICCLVPKSDTNTTLLTLSPGQSQLAFELSPAKDLSLCTLLEAGLKDTGLTFVAKLLRSEVHEDAILEWSHVHQYSNMSSVSPSHAVESKNNHFMVDIMLPRVWSQVASTHMGIAGPATGGLDLLVLYEALEAWHVHVGGVPSLVGTLFSDKASRDRRVLLTIVANAARNSMLSQRYFNPVHSDITLALRRCVLFGCLQQLWQTVPAFTESGVPQDKTESFERELVATLLAISARLYSQHEEDDNKCLSCDPPSRSETGSVGYMSISPSPSELAIPNAMAADFFDLRDIDYEPVFLRTNQPSLLALREAMLPLLAEAGLKVTPQLRPVCHNKDLFLGEVGVALKEISVFVTSPSHLHSSHTRHIDTPVLITKHIDVRSSMKYTTETTPSEPHLLLLPSNTAVEDVPSAKINLSSNCIISVEGISLTVTTPLLKLGRHMMETARYRSHVTRLTEICKEDNLTTPCPENYRPRPPPFELPDESIIFTSRIISFAKTVASIVDSQEVKSDSCHNVLSSPMVTVQSPSTSKLSSPQEELSRQLLRPQSPSSSVTSDDIAIAMENPTFAEALSDTLGSDTPDSLRATRDNSLNLLNPKTCTSIMTPKVSATKDHTSSVVRCLSLLPSQLLFSVYGLLRIKAFEVGVQIETTRASVLVEGVSGCVDMRKATKELEEPLSLYLSAAATIQKSSLVLSDRGLPESEVVLSFKAQPVYVSAGMCGGVELPTYRCLVKVRGVELSVPQSPVIIHRRYQALMPSFTAIYQDVFAKSEKTQPETPPAPVVNMADVKLPPKLPQGFVHFSLDETSIVLSPLPSLTVTYTVTPVVVQVETTDVIQFELSVGNHMVRFSPRGPHKDDLTLRSLPHLSLRGTVQGSRRTMIPSVRLKLSVKQVVIDITTDVLNQLLVLQNSFIKEVNDLIQLFSHLDDSIPQKRPIKQGQEEGPEVLSFLESCHLSLSGIIVTISTPLSTAIRFSTGKIEMNLVNASANNSAATLQRDSMTRSRFNVMGRVDIDVNAALGILQDQPDDELLELAYFKMRVSLRNTVQNLASRSEKGEERDSPVVVDTFAISILNPHLYVQSSAFEQGILFWLNCNSVYNYWQNERKQLNAEVQAATEALIERIQHRPTQLQTPSIDFSKPRLVKLTVSDVGVCMPLTPTSSTAHSTKSQSFPALVITIKEMQFQLNLSHKIASTGNFETFSIRFADHFYLRHKTWTLDPRKHKFANCGSIHHGTFRLCIANQKRVSETDPQVSVGEKLLWAFQWDMSGIDVNANTDIGRHTSAIVRTITMIGTDRDGSKISKTQSSTGVSSSHRLLRRPASVAGQPHHRRSKSVNHRHDDSYIMTLEVELAKQTRKVQNLKTQGVSLEMLQSEKEALRLLQDDLARAMRRTFRPANKSMSRWFTPRPQEAGEVPSGMGRKISQVVRQQLFSQQESSDLRDTTPSPTHSRRRIKSMPSGHRRFKSDVTGLKYISSSGSPSPNITPTPHDDDTFEPSDTEEVGVVNKEDEGFTLPTIDVEVDVTINVDYGAVRLRTEESQMMERKMSLPTLSGMHSPYASNTRLRTNPSESYNNPSIVESVILIPKLTVKAHYQSIVGRSYSNAPVPKSPSHSPPTNLLSDNLLPVKRGVLSISAVIASLPEPIRLSPSLLEFIEQVARPTIAATIISGSSASSTESEDEADPTPSSDNWPLSFPVDVTLAFQIQPSTMHLTCQPQSLVECVIQSPDVNFVISFSLFTPQHHESDKTTSLVGSGSGLRGQPHKILMFNNLYITGCLTTFALQLFTPPVSGRKSRLGLEKKEALSLTLGQALIHFSRRSVLSPHLSNTAQSVDDYVPSSKLQVSIVMDIASVVGGYDMRRLNDITAFRRYWYRTSLVEALFIGTKKKSHEEVSGASFDIPSDPEGEAKEAKEPSAVVDLNDTLSAVIVVAANVDDLRVSTNVAQVMGNTDLLVTQFRCEAHCDVQHNELVLLEMDGKLDKGELDARGGVIAGNILMKGAQARVTTQSVSGSVPVHKGSASLELVEGRVDYMSSCSLLARTTGLNLELSDSWEGLHLDPTGKSSEFASVQILAHFSWDKLQLSIHRSTTKSLFNMVQKMYEFVMQQKRRSERTISLMLPAGSAASKALHAYREEQKRMAKEEEARDKGYVRHHWLWAMRVGSVELMKTMGLHTPAGGLHTVSLGAKMSVSGDNFCLVCFHGPSFRETEWAVFNIDSISASFSTQAIPGLSKGKRAELTESGSGILPTKQVRTCQQIVNISLGHTPWDESEKLDKLAAIYRVSAGHGRPPSIVGTSTQNWLNYACIDAQLHPDSYSGDTSTLIRLSKKLNVQSILLVPAFEMELVTDHFWPQKTRLSGKEPQFTPLVECSLTSKFARGVSVATNVDHYLFLHDLVKAYLEYLEKHKTPQTLDTDPESTDTAPTSPAPKSTPVLRNFECVCWELDPHLCLLSSAGTGQFNPHISWLLERLGFKHAQTTVPKWIQRVAMDPLDMVVANAMELLIKITATKKLQQKSRASSPPSH